MTCLACNSWEIMSLCKICVTHATLPPSYRRWSDIMLQAWVAQTFLYCNNDMTWWWYCCPIKMCSSKILLTTINVKTTSYLHQVGRSDVGSTHKMSIWCRFDSNLKWARFMQLFNGNLFVYYHHSIDNAHLIHFID